MFSLKWPNNNLTNYNHWQHDLTIIVPTNLKYQTSFLYLNSGSTKTNNLSKMDFLIQIAINTKSITANLGQIPNQPIQFFDSNISRKEDQLIAYTFDKFLTTQKQYWPIILPMTKSVKMSLDAIQSFVKDKHQFLINDFVVSGRSKRGLIAWTIAAVDKRIKAIIPLVSDSLNMIPLYKNHRKIYGEWDQSLIDYEQMNIFKRINDPQLLALVKLIDPYSYLERLEIPKYIINASGDQYFPINSSHFYWKDLLGPKYLRLVPNSNHKINDKLLYQSVFSFYQILLNKHSFPNYYWESTDDNKLKVFVDKKPKEIKLWQSLNENSADFRLKTTGPNWHSTNLIQNLNGEIIADLNPPEKGYKAYFVELIFNNLSTQPFTLTTEVKIISSN